MATVEKVGVRNRLLTRPKADRIALYVAIDRVVRAVGRIVVWVDAAAELRTMSRSNLVMNQPIPDVPKTEVPKTLITSPELLGLASPMPLVPMPAYDCEAMTTRAYVTNRITVDSTAA